MGRTVRWLRDWLCKPVLITFLCVLSSSQATYGQAKDETTQQTNEKIQELASLGKSTLADIPIGAGDLLHIDVFDVPELSRDVRVGTTGGISFPLIHEKIRAAGATTFQLEQKIQDLLRQNGLVSDPQVSVFIKEQNSQPVTIIGAVVHPMTYQLNRPMSLLELIANCGGHHRRRWHGYTDYASDRDGNLSAHFRHIQQQRARCGRLRARRKNDQDSAARFA